VGSPSDPVRVALVSMDQHWRDPEANLARARRLLIDHVVPNGANAAIFPEMTLSGFFLHVGMECEEAAGSRALAGFAALAKEVGIPIVFGACLRDTRESRPRNVLAVGREDGTASAIYAKVHPFSFAGEHDIMEPGQQVRSFEFLGGNVGASICYDLRFPGLYSALAPEVWGAVCIANWPAARVEHWRVLLRARAIENQMFMIGVNRIGTDGNGIEYEKSSMVVGPDGRVLTPAVAAEEVDVFEIATAEALSYRESFPTLRDRRDISTLHTVAR
jgi:omega-amidase